MLPTSFSIFILLYSQNDLMTVFLGEAVALLLLLLLLVSRRSPSENSG